MAPGLLRRHASPAVTQEIAMRTALFTLACLAAATPAFAGDPAPTSLTAEVASKPAENAVYGEIGGQGLFYSVNYERFIRPDMGIRIGFGAISISASASDGMSTATSSATLAAAPIMFDYLGLHEGASALELGAGVDLMYTSGSASVPGSSVMASGLTPVPTATIGYRYSSPTGGFVFRAGYTPLFFITTQQKSIAHWGGMSFGYRF
jgi:hypothetical protein